MEADRQPDFSGWATKANVLCKDGRTIAPNAFAHQDQEQVPLVWQHGHGSVGNVLGHVLLTNKPEGVWADAFLNESEAAAHAAETVVHRDVRQFSIWANDLLQKASLVVHGAIREVSLVLKGANPEATIENIHIAHADGEEHELKDEAIIIAGEDFDEVNLTHGDLEGESFEDDGENVEHADDDETIADIFNSFSDDEKQVVYYMIGQAIEADKAAKHDDMGDSEDSEDDPADTLSHTDETDEGNKMPNVFDKTDKAEGEVLSHADVAAYQGEILADATRMGSLRGATEAAVVRHGITDISVLFPDAKELNSTPEFDKRRTEWVSVVWNGVSKRPFSRIKTTTADLTEDEARARGYITGNMKKEEFFRVKSRTTTPTTVYKKQRLDRDDILDITDFDVVMWIKGEMRMMIEEEIARAILLGDGRDVASEDKINEDNVRPIAYDNEAYTHVVQANIVDADSSFQEVIDAIIRSRRFLKGSGTPTFFTTESYIASAMLLKDTLGRRIYTSLEDLARELRVARIVPVEVMEEHTDLVGVIVNLADYVVGADKGGQLTTFDDFDIDFNQYKYLIESRLSGALVKLKSAMVVKTTALTLAVPEEPGFVAATGVVTIPIVTGVQYEDASDPGVALSDGAQAPLGAGNSITIVATSTGAYYFEGSETVEWEFTQNP